MKHLDTMCHETQLFHSFLFILLILQPKKDISTPPHFVWVFASHLDGTITAPTRLSGVFLDCKLGHEFGFRFYT